MKAGLTILAVRPPKVRDIYYANIKLDIDGCKINTGLACLTFIISCILVNYAVSRL